MGRWRNKTLARIEKIKVAPFRTVNKKLCGEASQCDALNLVATLQDEISCPAHLNLGRVGGVLDGEVSGLS